MAKVKVIRNYLALEPQRLPPTPSELEKRIEDLAKGLHLKLSLKEKQEIITAYFPKGEKRPDKGPKTQETTKATAEPK